MAFGVAYEDGEMARADVATAVICAWLRRMYGGREIGLCCNVGVWYYCRFVLLVQWCWPLGLVVVGDVVRAVRDGVRCRHAQGYIVCRVVVECSAGYGKVSVVVLASTRIPLSPYPHVSLGGIRFEWVVQVAVMDEVIEYYMVRVQ